MPLLERHLPCAGKHIRPPADQVEPDDTAGLNSVPVNRALQRLRAEDVIILSKSADRPDAQRLMSISEFNANYLHFDNSRRPISCGLR